MARIDFKGGWWADVKDAWSYGSDARIAGAWAFADTPETYASAATVTLVECVTGGHLPGPDGAALPFSAEMWEQVDGRIGRRLLRECRDRWGRWQREADPFDTGTSSDESLPESA